MIAKVIIGASLLSMGYSIYKYGVDSIETTKYIIENEKIPSEFNDFKIVHISDLHNKSFGIGNKNLIEKIDNENPDAIFITGDLIDGDSKNFDTALSLIEDLSKRYNIYHIIGNHEQKSLVKKHRDLYMNYFKRLYRKNIVNIEDNIVKIKKGNSTINLYGLIIPLEFYTYFFSNSKKTIKLEERFVETRLGKINKNEYNILLSHSPFYFNDYANWGADLILAGHVHGGIIRIPFKGGLLSPNREFFPEYDFGEYNKNNSTMLLTKGLGGSKLLMRVNCRPEIVSITLKSKIN
ncbi:metallophosphoesterase [Romboutsia weinsteinii]|uniref:Metallophosphoesterase n=2 Tax=Romboutsia weinsteinii TaxID=2020949 RepID=A0A371JA36_9FIRM|nr:metallophosphoesterase [Romboutsia weinsteinii]